MSQTQQVDEVGRTARMFGTQGAATLKQFANRFMPGGDRAEGQLSIADKMHKERFINGLISAAFKSLQSEIAAGRVDPNIKSVVSPSPAPQADPAQTKQTAANNAANAADNELVARVRAEKQKPGFQQNKGLIRQAALKGIHEEKYEKLNRLFESMLTEAESVEQWLKRFLPTYLRGIPISDTTTQNLIRAAGDSYDPKNIKAFQQAMLKLGNAIFATAQSPGYAGAESPAQPRAAARAPGATAGSSPAEETGADTVVNSIQSLLVKLKSMDPSLHAQIVKKIGSGESLQASSSVAGKPSTPAAPVSESRKKRK